LTRKADTELEFQFKLKDQTQQQAYSKFIECQDKHSFVIVKEIWAAIRSMNDYFQEGSKLLQKYVAQIEQSSNELEERQLQTSHERESVTPDQFFTLFETSNDASIADESLSVSSPDDSPVEPRRRAPSVSSGTVVTSNPLYQSTDDSSRSVPALSLSRDESRKKSRKTPRSSRVPELSLLSVPPESGDTIESPSTNLDDSGGSLSPRQRSARRSRPKNGLFLSFLSPRS